VTITKILESVAKVGGGLAVIVGVVFYVIHAETSQMRSDISVLQSSFGTTRDDIASLKNDIKSANERIDKTLSDALNAVVSGRKKNSQGNKIALQRGETVLSIAKSVNAKLAPSALNNYGQLVSKLSESPSLSTIAWQSLTNAVAYRSFLNADYIPKLSDLTPVQGGDEYRSALNLRPDETVVPRGPSMIVYFAGGRVAPQKSARLEILAAPQSVSSNFGLFVVEGGVDFLVLDGMYMKNVIVRNAKIIYEGGPVKLENVYFVNCTFTLAKSQPVRELSNVILRAASVDFSKERRS
jgi:hypothetical protein